MVQKMPESEIAASQIDNNDDLWELMDRMSRPIGGGDGTPRGDDFFAELGVSEEEGKNLFNRAVEGVSGFLKGIHLPRWERKQGTAGAMLGLNEQPAAAEAAEAGRNRLFGWFGEIGRRFNEWRKQPLFREREEAPPPVPREVLLPPESEADIFGWLENSLKWLRGAPGGLINKFRRQGETVAAPQISRAERVKALREGTTQFLKDWGPEIAVGLLGGYLGYSTVSMETMVATGSLAPIAMEVGAVLTAGFGFTGLVMGDERGPDAILETEGRFGKVATAIRRGCSNRVVRRGLKLLTAGSGGFAAGGAGRLAVETFQFLAAPFPSAGGGAPAEAWNVGGNVAPGQMTPDQLGGQIAQEAAQQGLQQAAQGGLTGGMTPEQLAAANAAGQEGASWAAQNAVHAADVVKSVAEAAAQAAADAAAAQAQGAEAARQGILQGGQVMEDVIAATPSGTAFEALQQQVFRVTGSPYAAEVANAMSWALPKGDITGLHVGAIQEGAKTVAGFLQQAHDFAAANGGEYTVHAIRQAVSDGRLSQDVLRAVEAANLPAGADKNQAIEALNTVLQGVVK